MNTIDADDLFETVCLLIEAYVKLNAVLYAQPNFHSNVVKDVTALLKKTIEEAFTADEEDVVNVCTIDMLKQISERGLQLFYKHIVPPRDNGNTFIRKIPNINIMEAKIAYLQNLPQPDQRTSEWYEFRYKHLTASNIWKAFSTESAKNQLIFEKCQPYASNDKFSAVNIESPLHWGQKYEPLSIQLYESMYNTQVSDFGCIPHRNIHFIAASPDGINTQKMSERYGRMLEVKNIVNREITGKPKLEYWIQMQVQLEVCDLNECDFLETRFIEYPDEEAFNLDTETSNKKGLMMLFMTSNNKPVYEYAPLILNPAAHPQWQEEMMEKNKELNWLKNIYWKLDQLSCVLVLRNKLWFAAALPILKDVWKTIETEKKNGYAHRGPKKNNNKAATSNNAKYNDENLVMPAKCFITIET
jgi:putative phage-type endonuclease